MEIPSDEWLERINREFQDQNIHVWRRPFLAINRYCHDFKVQALRSDSLPAKNILT